VTLRILSYNIKHGGNGREAVLADVIRSAQADVVVFQEASRPQVVEQIARETGFDHWGSRRGESLGYLARVPLDHVRWRKPRISRHAFIEIVPAGCAWRIVGVHLSAVHAAWTEHRRRYELRALLLAIQQHQFGPHVLVGDFNTLAPGELLDFTRLPPRLRALVWLSGGRVRWRTIQGVLDAGYVDAFRALNPDLVGYTFPTWDPHVRLDYMFVPQACTARVARCQVFSATHVCEASDHFPLIAELS
jgi:exodeoxyribonuclease-3